MKTQGAFRTYKERGEWVELQFVATAAQHGLRAVKPYGDSARYDFIVETERGFARVQVKSTAYKVKRTYACCAHPNQRTRPYTRREFDFLAAYVIPEDVWYIIPARRVLKGNMGFVSLSPSVPGHKYEKYKEAWELLRRGSGRKIAQLSAAAAPASLGMTRNRSQPRATQASLRG